MKFLADYSRRLPVFLLIIWGGLLYSNTLDVPFYFDDVLNIVEPPALHLKELSSSALGKVLHEAHLTTRPVANLSFALNYYLQGFDVGGYHLVNIFIHLFCAILIYFLSRKTLALAMTGTDLRDERIIAFFAALIWLVHPVNTQTVTYVVQRMNGLATMFFLLSFYGYILGRQRESGTARTRYFLLALLSWLFALGSKEIAVMLPPVVLLYEWLFFQKGEVVWLKNNISYIALFSLLMIIPVVCYSGLSPLGAVLAGYEFRDFSLLERVLTQTRVVIHYASLLFFPAASRLSLEHDFSISTTVADPMNTMLSLVVLVALTWLSLAKAKENRLLFFGILWFLINLVLESSLIPLEIIFEHRTYLPYVFLILAIVQFAFSRIGKKNIVIGFMSVVVLFFSFWTFQRNSLWREPVSFWQQTVAGAPDNARANNYLGMALTDENRYDEAIPSLRKAIRLQPLYYHAHNNLGVALLRKGLFGEASRHFEIAARGKGVKDEAYNNLGMSYASRRDLFAALKYFPCF